MGELIDRAMQGEGDPNDLLNAFGNLPEQLEAAGASTTGESEDIAKEDRWKAKRVGKITSSKLPDFMTSGRAKGEVFGQKAITAMLAVAHERRTGVERPDLPNFKALEHGRKYENEALNFYQYKKGIKMLSCQHDFRDIVFYEPFEGFGDSPDGVTEDGIGSAEIKCPASGAVHLRYTAIKAFYEGVDYYWQILGHLLKPEIEWCDFISYDAFAKDEDPLKLFTVRVFKMDHALNVNRLRDRIDLANVVINAANLKNDMSIILNVNQYDFTITAEEVYNQLIK